MESSLLNPCNDYVFKRLFSDAPHLLSDFINAVRGARAAPIEVVEILNPWIDPKHIGGKFTEFDLLVKDWHGNFFNIEIQIRNHEGWLPRIMYYLLRISAQRDRPFRPIVTGRFGGT